MVIFLCENTVTIEGLAHAQNARISYKQQFSSKLDKGYRLVYKLSYLVGKKISTFFLGKVRIFKHIHIAAKYNIFARIEELKNTNHVRLMVSTNEIESHIFWSLLKSHEIHNSIFDVRL
jgi:hypothetical protein